MLMKNNDVNRESISQYKMQQ